MYTHIYIFTYIYICSSKHVYVTHTYMYKETYIPWGKQTRQEPTRLICIYIHIFFGRLSFSTPWRCQPPSCVAELLCVWPFCTWKCKWLYARIRVCIPTPSTHFPANPLSLYHSQYIRVKVCGLRFQSCCCLSKLVWLLCICKAIIYMFFIYEYMCTHEHTHVQKQMYTHEHAHTLCIPETILHMQIYMLIREYLYTRTHTHTHAHTQKRAPLCPKSMFLDFLKRNFLPITFKRAQFHPKRALLFMTGLFCKKDLPSQVSFAKESAVEFVEWALLLMIRKSIPLVHK